MRCLNCNQVIKGMFEYCPICGTKVEEQHGHYNNENPVVTEEEKKEKIIEMIKNTDPEDEDVVDLSDLPELKDSEDKVEIDMVDNNLSDNEEEYDYKGVETKDYEIDDKEYQAEIEEAEKTQMISKVNDDDVSLTAAINLQIEEFNNEHKDEEVVREQFNSDKSVNDRKTILTIVAIIMVAIGCTLCFAVSFIIKPDDNKNNSSENSNKGYSVKDVDTLYNNYLNSNNDIELKKLLDDNKDDIKDIQEEMYKCIDKSLDNVIDNTYSNVDIFNNDIDRHKRLINNIYSLDSDSVKLLDNEKYDELLNKLNLIHSDGKGYFEALGYYNEKSYNEAYYLFGKIKESSIYYNKAINYLDLIIENVMASINNDIVRVEDGIESKSDDEKLQVYSAVEDIIRSYDSIYDNLKLSENDSYNQLLNSYIEKVNQYSN